MKKQAHATRRSCVALRLLSLSLAMLISIGMMSGCSFHFTGGEGKSAYDIAVEHGFEGSESEWLESLKGSDGANGKDGKDGKDGADGKDGGSEATGGTQTVIQINGANDVSAAAATALRSTVSVSAGFIIEYVTGGGWWGEQQTQQYSATSRGSGVIYQLNADGDAFIITNYHVVYHADSISEDGISEDIHIYQYGMNDEAYAIPATYVGGSMYYDIAVLRVEDSERLKNSGAVAATLGNADEIVPGQSAIAVGNPAAGGLSVTGGIISVASEHLTMTAADETTTVTFRTIRVDTPINSGNSGGGLYNAKGELIGIVNAKISSSTVENIGFAIPVSIAEAVAENIIDNCYGSSHRRVLRPILGVQLEATDLNMVYDAQTGTVDVAQKVSVAAITEGSAADGLLCAGDVIRSVTVGQRSVDVSKTYHVIDLMLYARAGDTVHFVVERDGVTRNIEVNITEDLLIEY